MHNCHFFPISCALRGTPLGMGTLLQNHYPLVTWVRSMFEYRVYLLNQQGHVDEVPRLVRCATDEDAERRARQLQERQAVEVWQGARLVAKIAPPQ